MVILDSTIVNVAVPALRTGLHADAADLEWVIDGYLLMLAALVLAGGAFWLGGAIAAVAVPGPRTSTGDPVRTPRL